MKRFMVLAVAVLAVLAIGCSAGAADFSGKWVNYKMYVENGDEVFDFNLDEEGVAEADMGYVEFKDGKVIWLMSGGEEEDIQEFTYKASGDKLVVDLPSELAEGIGPNASAEIYFEGDDLVFHLKSDEGVMKSSHRRPK